MALVPSLSAARSALAPARALPILAGQRGMATLQEIKMRLTSVKNIQKITKSMKMVSAAKYAKAERDLRAARGLASAATGIVTSAGITLDKVAGRVVVAMSSDRGLCGGIHSSITKAVRPVVAEDPQAKLFLVGDKVRGQLNRICPQNINAVFTDVGKKPPTFAEASQVALKVLESDIGFEKGQVIFNKFKSVISYESTSNVIFSANYMQNAEEFIKYESVEDETFQSYAEFHLVSSVYGAMIEGAASEQSARMQAMENATKNAGEMIGKLTLAYNRTRQAVITNELIEIISGAAAV